MFYAYRKAKADCFFERSLPVAREFVNYESALPKQLHSLLERLRSGQVREILLESIGEPRLAAKKLGTSPKKNSSPTHGFYSDPSRAFQHLVDTHYLEPEFRLIGDFSVQMHIMSALWINLIGHKFDGALSRSAYGARLRRFRLEPGSPEKALGEYHIAALGSFQPYFRPYKQWRERGLSAIRKELKEDRGVIAITMDLTSYYHRIDPAFIANRKFLDYSGIDLNDGEMDFTNAFAEALAAWSSKAQERLRTIGCNLKEKGIGGLPIGLSVSRIIANALLIGLDREIDQQLSPVYYGRYIDDLFLVLRDPETVHNMSDLLKFIHNRTNCFPKEATNEKEIYLKLPGEYQGQTTLLLQQSKQKIFFLEGQGGLDLLSSIESQIRSVSSERRLMPSPDNLETMAAAKVLTAAGQASQEADTLRRADGLAVRRLGWSVLLRSVETLARDLRQPDWKTEREQFYKFAHNHILRPDRIFDHLDYLPRLLSLAVALMDWPNAKRLVESAVESLDKLRKKTEELSIKVNGFAATKGEPALWDEVRKGVIRSAADAIIRSLRWSQRSGKPSELSDTAINVCNYVGLDSTKSDLLRLALAIRESDWAKVAYKDHLRRDAESQRPEVPRESSFHQCYEKYSDLREFLEASAKTNQLSTNRIHPRCQQKKSKSKKSKSFSVLPHLFPTRPYTAQEIALYHPNKCVFFEKSNSAKGPAGNWARYVRAIRGVGVWDTFLENSELSESKDSTQTQNSLRKAVLGKADYQKPIRLGISSLETADESWSAAAHGRVDLSRNRYARLEQLVNQAIQAHPRPTHLILPELSLPERWIDTVAGRLRDSGISLIAGLDYHHKSRSEIHSEAVLVLTDDRLGFPAHVEIHQPKLLPAPKEEFRLKKIFGKTWSKFSRLEKPVYIHKGFAFGVLICSELQNVKHRLEFQGAIDCLMVLSWNKDLETFSALVESASLDIHAYIAIVNNALYGDSRIRVPAKAEFARDVCRLRGGENAHVVVAKLDILKLRSFQSRDSRWPDRTDPFKPVPEAFQIRNYRARTPE